MFKNQRKHSETCHVQIFAVDFQSTSVGKSTRIIPATNLLVSSYMQGISGPVSDRPAVLKCILYDPHNRVG